MDLRESPKRAFRRHPWEVARFEFFRRVLVEAKLDQRPLRVLDVGSGDGWFASQLLGVFDGGSTCVCWDIGYQASALPQALSAPGLSGVSERPNERFDLILLLDVVEHVAEDEAFLAEILRHCAHSGSTVLFSVPAWPALTSAHDARLEHFRRYSPAQARGLLLKCGLKVRLSGGVFHSLLVPRALSALCQKLTGIPRTHEEESLEWQHGPLVAACAETVLELDGALSRGLARRNLEFPGLSWWALCQT